MNPFTFYENLIGFHPTAECIHALIETSKKENFSHFNICAVMYLNEGIEDPKDVLKELATFNLDSVFYRDELFNMDEPLKHTGGFQFDLDEEDEEDEEND